MTGRRHFAQLHRDVAAALRLLVKRSHICVNPRDAFVLVDDDVTLCPGAAVHIAAVLRWLRQATNTPVYIRLAVGFLGTLFHCGHLDAILEHFDRVARSNDPVQEQTLASAFPDQGLVYRWNLLEVRPDGSPEPLRDGGDDESEAEAPVRRRGFVPPLQCWDMQLAMPLSEFQPGDQGIFAYPGCKHHAASPCGQTDTSDRPPLLLNATSEPDGVWPAVPPHAVPRWFEPDGATTTNTTGSVSLAELGQSCEVHCQSRGAVCTTPAMRRANTVGAIEALVAKEEGGGDGAALQCRTVSGDYNDVEFSPRLDILTGHCVLLVQPDASGWCAFVPRWQHLHEPDHFRRFCGCEDPPAGWLPPFSG